MSFLNYLFRKKDDYEQALRNAESKLGKYENSLLKELRKWETVPPQRATEIEAAYNECKKKLLLLYNWSLLDLLDTFYKQAVLIMKRAWLRSLVDQAAVQALNDQLIATRAWRKQLLRFADERAAALARSPAGSDTPKRTEPASSSGSSPKPDVPLPLDVGAFMQKPGEIVRDFHAVQKLQRRIIKINGKLAEIDAHIQTLKPLLRPIPRVERRATLVGLLNAEAECELKEAIGEGDTADVLQRLASQLCGSQVQTQQGNPNNARHGMALHPCAKWVYLLLKLKAEELFESAGIGISTSARKEAANPFNAPPRDGVTPIQSPPIPGLEKQSLVEFTGIQTPAATVTAASPAAIPAQPPPVLTSTRSKAAVRGSVRFKQSADLEARGSHRTGGEAYDAYSALDAVRAGGDVQRTADVIANAAADTANQQNSERHHSSVTSLSSVPDPPQEQQKQPPQPGQGGSATHAPRSDEESLSVLYVLYTSGIVLPASVAVAVVNGIAPIGSPEPGRKSSTGFGPVFDSLSALHNALLGYQKLVRERKVFQREFRRVIADQRTREGRLLQRWCQKVLAAGAEGEYAYDLTRYLSFDPGQQFAHKTKLSLHIGVPLMAYDNNALQTGRSDSPAWQGSIPTAAVVNEQLTAPLMRGGSAVFVVGAGTEGVTSPVSFAVATSARADAAVASAPSGKSFTSPTVSPYEAAASPVEGAFTTIGGLTSPIPVPPDAATQQVNAMLIITERGSTVSLSSRPHLSPSEMMLSPPDSHVSPTLEAAGGAGQPASSGKIVDGVTLLTSSADRLPTSTKKGKDRSGKRPGKAANGAPSTASSVPTPRTITAFLKHYTNELANEYELIDTLSVSLTGTPKPTMRRGPSFFAGSRSPSVGAGSAVVSPNGQINTAEALRLLRGYVDRLVYPRLHAVVFSGIDVTSPHDVAVPTDDQPQTQTATVMHLPLSQVVGMLQHVPNHLLSTVVRPASTPSVDVQAAVEKRSVKHEAALTASSLSGPTKPSDPLASPITPPVPSSLAPGDIVKALLSPGGHTALFLQQHGLLTATMPVITIVNAPSSSRNAAVEGAIVSLPVRHPSSAADVMYKRDRYWLRRQPKVSAMSAHEIGVPAKFMEALPCDVVVVHSPPDEARLAYAYEPYAISSQLLACMDLCTTPAEMLTYLFAAVDAGIEEATARATVARSKKDPNDKNEISQVTAEDLMPLFIYVCSRSSWRRPHACLSYLANYAVPPSQHSGKEAYIITVLQSCISWICTWHGSAGSSPAPSAPATGRLSAESDTIGKPAGGDGAGLAGRHVEAAVSTVAPGGYRALAPPVPEGRLVAERRPSLYTRRGSAEMTMQVEAVDEPAADGVNHHDRNVSNADSEIGDYDVDAHELGDVATKMGRALALQQESEGAASDTVPSPKLRRQLSKPPSKKGSHMMPIDAGMEMLRQTAYASSATDEDIESTDDENVKLPPAVRPSTDGLGPIRQPAVVRPRFGTGDGGQPPRPAMMGFGEAVPGADNEEEDDDDDEDYAKLLQEADDGFNTNRETADIQSLKIFLDDQESIEGALRMLI